MKRTYGFLQIKSVEETNERREFTGIANTGAVDLYGDIVEPSGAEYTLPLPLISQHDSHKPIGFVTEAKVVEQGIEIRAHVEKMTEPGTLKERLDLAWQEIKLGLVRGLSIGFVPIESARIEGTYGYRFTKWKWLELSPVTIPANQEATIQNIRAFATGRPSSTDTRALPGYGTAVTLASTAPTRSSNSQGVPMKILDQIRAFEAKRQASSERMTQLMQRAGDENRTLEANESEEYDGLATEVRSVDEHLVRLRGLEAANVANARSIDETNRAGNGSGGGAVHVQTVHVQKPLAKGIEFARYALCLIRSRGNRPEALEIAKTHFPEMTRIHAVLKAAVAAGTTTDPTWAGALVDYQTFAGDFVDFLRPMTIIGKFGQGGVPSLKAAPFNVHIKGQTSGGAGYWVGQGKAKPLTKFDFADTYLGFTKVAGITVITEELARFSNPSAEALCRDALAAAIIERIDKDFVDPTKAAVADVSPASIVNGVAAIPSSGTDAAAIRADVQAIMAPFIAAGISLAQGVWIMPTAIALTASLAQNPLGQPEFPGLSVNGGTFMGLPVIVSDYVPSDTVELVAANEVWLADDGNVTIAVSPDASLEMSDAPTQDAKAGTGAQLVSMFQADSIAIRAERYINWKKRRAAAAQWLDGVAWTGGAAAALAARRATTSEPQRKAT